MLFNSFTFLLFLLIVLTLYWTLKKNRNAQNVLIVVSSYVFYGWWDWRFLFLLLFSSLCDFFLGHAIASSDNANKKKQLLILSLSINLGLLGFFKYYNFFVDSFVTLLTSLGLHASHSTLNIILPVGISFYTFQTLSYTLDIYKKRLTPTRNLIEFVAFVSFFPQLVAGPIERAKDLLPQFQENRKFRLQDFKSGLQQIFAGLVKKMVIADNCSVVVDQIFNLPEYNNAALLVLGAIFFAFQIYGDFSGYSDIGIGVARLLGFKLNPNFRYPYFSSSVREFWQNWHISLSSWFRDYVYIPLGGNRDAKWKTNYNLLFTFTLSGLWHGANFTFILWGFINGLYLVVENLFRKKIVQPASSLVNLGKVLFTFFLINITWVFFRAESLNQAFAYLLGIVTSPETLLSIGSAFQQLGTEGKVNAQTCLFLVSLLLVLELLNKNKPHFLDISEKPFFQRIPIYFCSLLIWIMFGSFFGTKEFIYFQF